jgi:hypothetical protein
MSYLKGCRVNVSGYGISNNITKRTLELMEIAALTILLTYRKKMVLISLFRIRRKSF